MQVPGAIADTGPVNCSRMAKGGSRYSQCPESSANSYMQGCVGDGA